jgi:membrane fusion protein (multidrug efflux system)
MAIRIILTVLGLLLIVGGLAGVKGMQFGAMSASAANAGPPPESVAAADVNEVTWQPMIDAVGTITAVQGVTLTAEVPGTVRRIAFDSGVLVKAGQVLVELDASTERAQLLAAQATAEMAHVNLDSGKALERSGSIAATQFKQYVATAKQAEAELTRLQSIIDKKTIRAPFAGRTGIRQINLGQFMGNGDKIVSLQSPDPVYVDFSLPQQRLAELTEGLDVQVTTDSFPNEAYPGKLSAIQPELDAATRNVLLRATLQNPKGQLRPGMFVRAQVVLPKNEKVVVVPATAIMYAPYGDSVFLLTPPPPSKDGKPAVANALVAQQTFVRLGETRGDFVAITKGLKPGDKVVVTGAFKLRSGAPVVVNNDLLPSASENPKPDDT